MLRDNLKGSTPGGDCIFPLELCEGADWRRVTITEGLQGKL